MNTHRGHGAERDEIREPDGCAAFGPLLAAYYHHALEPQQAQSVAEHAAGCALCRAALEHFAATDQLIAAAPTPAPGPALRQRLAARIAAEHAARLAGATTPVSIERTTVVNDLNDLNDSPWTTTETQTAAVGKHRQWMRVAMGTAAAIVVVTLLAGVLLTRPGGPATGVLASTPTPGVSNQSGTPTAVQTVIVNGVQFTKPAGTCDPTKITAQLPSRALLFDLDMVSPDEGWAVGALEDASNGDPVGSLILHYSHCSWTPVLSDHSGVTLMSVSMSSATDGWAVGGTSGGQQLALHYTGGAWQPVTLPGENTFDGGYAAVQMRSANDGWIVVGHAKNQQGQITENLLYLANGHWSAITAPFAIVNDILPVTANEAWMAGYRADGQQSPVLYHYQAGAWASVALPPGVIIDRLRMVSPNDIWASGHINGASNVDDAAKPVVMHYDGSNWQQVNTGASGQPQYIQAFDQNTSWAFTLSSAFPADIIGSVRYQRAGSWLAVKWPFHNMTMGSLYFGMNTIQRVSADEYWTIGLTDTSQSALLYFASGTWRAYGQ